MFIEMCVFCWLNISLAKCRHLVAAFSFCMFNIVEEEDRQEVLTYQPLSKTWQLHSRFSLLCCLLKHSL